MSGGLFRYCSIDSMHSTGMGLASAYGDLSGLDWRTSSSHRPNTLPETEGQISSHPGHPNHRSDGACRAKGVGGGLFVPELEPK